MLVHLIIGLRPEYLFVGDVEEIEMSCILLKRILYTASVFQWVENYKEMQKRTPNRNISLLWHVGKDFLIGIDITNDFRDEIEAWLLKDFENEDKPKIVAIYAYHNILEIIFDDVKPSFVLYLHERFIQMFMLLTIANYNEQSFHRKLIEKIYGSRKSISSYKFHSIRFNIPLFLIIVSGATEGEIQILKDFGTTLEEKGNGFLYGHKIAMFVIGRFLPDRINQKAFMINPVIARRIEFDENAFRAFKNTTECSEERYSSIINAIYTKEYGAVIRATISIIIALCNLDICFEVLSELIFILPQLEIEVERYVNDIMRGLATKESKDEIKSAHLRLLKFKNEIISTRNCLRKISMFFRQFKYVPCSYADYIFERGALMDNISVCQHIPTIMEDKNSLNSEHLTEEIYKKFKNITNDIIIHERSLLDSTISFINSAINDLQLRYNVITVGQQLDEIKKQTKYNAIALILAIISLIVTIIKFIL